MFEPIEISFSYIKNGIPNRAVFKKSFHHHDFTAEVQITENGYRRLQISLIPTSGLEITNIQVAWDFPFHEDHRIFVNGYQSWTDSREFFPDEKLKGISILATPILERYQLTKYGDYTFYKYPCKKGVFHGYTYSYIRSGREFYLVGSLSERNGFTVIEEYVKQRKIIIKKECSGLQINRRYDVFDLVSIEGAENDVFDRYFQLMNLPTRLPARIITGWSSWYNYFQNINQEIILKNLANFDRINPKIDIFQIDDGYQTAVGDWFSINKDKFPSGMKFSAAAIKAKGYKAGIWLAPFACERNSVIFREKPDWFVKDKKGRPFPAGFNWSGFYSLDFYHPDVRAHLKKVFQMVFDDWGYDLVKLDFLYAVCLLPGKHRTRGQIMTEAMEFLRECAGDKLILGCGVPLGPAFGMVDFCRIGCDIRLDWDDNFLVRLLANRERDSTLNAIQNTIGRRQLNQRVFVNDPDVFLLRDDNIKLSEIQRKTLSFVDYIFGGLLFTSDDIHNYSRELNTRLEKIFRPETRTVEQVESLRNGLVKVLYTERGQRRLALINLSNREVAFSNPYGTMTEISFFNQEINTIKAVRIIIAAFDSRIFRV
jgi:alpha-galactosidase